MILIISFRSCSVLAVFRIFIILITNWICILNTIFIILVARRIDWLCPFFLCICLKLFYSHRKRQHLLLRAFVSHWTIFQFFIFHHSMKFVKRWLRSILDVTVTQDLFLSRVKTRNFRNYSWSTFHSFFYTSVALRLRQYSGCCILALFWKLRKSSGLLRSSYTQIRRSGTTSWIE